MAAVAPTGGNSSREARRRRIVERGSDRLALITGRIQSLPPEPDQSRSAACLPGQIPADSAPHEDVVSRSPLPTHESVKEPVQLHVSNETVPPSHPSIDKGRSSVSSREEGPLGREQEVSRISSSLQSTERAHHQLGQNHRNPFTASQVRAAIAASEKIRIYSSVAAAILVILSYIQFPVLGSVLIIKPIYMLLLTSISIVLARLILGREGAELRNRQRSSVPSIGGNGAIDQLGKALESGLLLQKVFGALFMDFSIYAVVLICGLSLVRNLGW